MTRRAVVAGAWLLLLAAPACGGRQPVTRVVVVTLDTTRADHIGCYGDANAKTPALDGLARTAVLFEQAVAPAPATLPSHATMFTGLYPPAHGVHYNVTFTLRPEVETLAERLKAAGFATAAFPATFVLDARFGLAQGFDTYDGPPAPANAGSLESERPAGEGVDRALRWLEAHKGEKSFLWLHVYDPHWPYAPPFPYSAAFKTAPYDGEIAYADAQLERLFAALASDPMWSRTMLVVAGDHGEGLYDHGERYHSLLTYESTLRVPLIVRIPGGTKGRRVVEPVSLADLAPTVLDCAGLEPFHGAQGVSFAAALRGGDAPAQAIYFESLVGAMNYGWSSLRGVRQGRWKLTESSSPELYDLRADPGETRNVFESERERAGELRGELAALETSMAGRVPGGSEAPPLDAATLAAFSSLGYVGGADAPVTTTTGPHPRTKIGLEPEMLAAQGAFVQQDWGRLATIAHTILGDDPSNRLALYHAAYALAQIRRSGEAEAAARELIRLYPDSDAHYDLLAQVLGSEGRMREAYGVYDRALTMFPRSPLLEEHARLTANRGGHGDPCAVVRPGGWLDDPQSATLLLAQARCLALSGKNGPATERIRKALAGGVYRADEIRKMTEFSSLAKNGELEKVLGGPRLEPPLPPR